MTDRSYNYRSLNSNRHLRKWRDAVGWVEREIPCKRMTPTSARNPCGRGQIMPPHRQENDLPMAVSLGRGRWQRPPTAAWVARVGCRRLLMAAWVARAGGRGSCGGRLALHPSYAVTSAHCRMGCARWVSTFAHCRMGCALGCRGSCGGGLALYPSYGPSISPRCSRSRSYRAWAATDSVRPLRCTR